MSLGKLVPPFPVESCANLGCPHKAGIEALDEKGAYLYRDLREDTLLVFCGDCALHAELHQPERFRLVPL